MTTSEFVKRYILHDSLIDNVEVIDGGKTITIKIDFAFWMQNWYEESLPETGIIKVVFDNVMEYSMPNGVDWSEVSILEALDKTNCLKLSLLNDITDEYLEIVIKPESITVIDDNLIE